MLELQILNDEINNNKIKVYIDLKFITYILVLSESYVVAF